MGWFTRMFNPAEANGHVSMAEGEPDAAFGLDIPAELTEAMSMNGSLARRVSRREALQVPAVLRSRNLIAGTLARLPVHVSKDRQMEDPTGLLAQIDPDVPNVVTFAQTFEDLLFESISWWRVTRVGWHGYPVEAYHVSTDRVHVSGGLGLPLVNGHQTIVPAGSQVFIDGVPVRDEEVIRFDSPNPPLLVHAARAIRACLRLDETAARFADEPLPLGYFTPREPGRVSENEDQIKATLNRFKEANRKRVWGYVGGAWEAKALQFDAEKIQLADQRQHAVLEIARAAGVDPEDLGVSTTSRTYQNAEQRRQDLLDFTLADYMTAVEQRLSMRDVLPRGYRAKFNLDGFLRSDTKTRMETHEIGIRAGVTTVDEARELEDRPPLTSAEKSEIAQRTQPMEPANER